MTERIAPLSAILAQIPDPRGARGRQYAWLPLLLLLVAGLLSGANSQRALARWGHNIGRARLRRLGLPGGHSPSQPTLHRLLRDVDLDLVESVLGVWLQQVRAAWRRSTKRWVDGIALDGKTLRGARRLGAAGSHLLAACGHRDGLVLAQVAVVDHAGELSGISALLEALLVQSQTVTMDAAFTQWTVAQQIVRQGGAYFMVVKGNQPEVRAAIAGRTAYRGRCLGEVHTQRVAHGRVELRTLRVAKAPPDLGWPHAHQVLSLKRHVVSKRTGEVISDQTVFAVTSLAADQASPTELLRLWLSHWRIESLFWLRDAVFGEDHSTTRTRHAHQAFAAFRNLVISLIHLWRGSHVTAAREYFARYPAVLFRHLQLPSPGGPVGTGVASPPPGQNPTCAINASGSPEQIGLEFVRRSHPCLRQSWSWNVEPELAIQRLPVMSPLAPLAATPQGPPPALPNSKPHAVQRARAVVQSEVLVEAQQHRFQMGLLFPDRLVPIRLEPRLNLAHKALARLDARFALNQHSAAFGPRPEVDEAKEGEGLGLSAV
jgi:predicted transposase YbfD/YdcC